jgi:hypothetical protein
MTSREHLIKLAKECELVKHGGADFGYEDALVLFAQRIEHAHSQRIAQWVQDMCPGLDHQQIAKAIKLGGNDSPS